MAESEWRVNRLSCLMDIVKNANEEELDAIIKIVDTVDTMALNTYLDCLAFRHDHYYFPRLKKILNPFILGGSD